MIRSDYNIRTDSVSFHVVVSIFCTCDKLHLFFNPYVPDTRNADIFIRDILNRPCVLDRRYCDAVGIQYYAPHNKIVKYLIIFKCQDYMLLHPTRKTNAI